MDPKTIILRCIDGREWRDDYGYVSVAGFDVVAGNRYRIDHGKPGLVPVPDDAGPWLALVTFRGDKAPPRPEVLSVGARVRKGAGWLATNLASGKGGIVDRGYRNDTYDILWDDRPDVCGEYARAELEVVSLPEAKPEAKAEPWPVDAVLWTEDSGGRWFTQDGRHHARAYEDGFVNSHAQPRLAKARITKGRRYEFASDELREAPAGAGWLCVRDYVGPDYREPEQAKAEPEGAKAPAKPPADSYTAHRLALIERGIEIQLCHDIPDDTVPSERLAYRAAHRPQVSSDFRVVTDTWDGFIPDADEGMRARLR